MRKAPMANMRSAVMATIIHRAMPGPVKFKWSFFAMITNGLRLRRQWRYRVRQRPARDEKSVLRARARRVLKWFHSIGTILLFQWGQPGAGLGSATRIRCRTRRNTGFRLNPFFPRLTAVLCFTRPRGQYEPGAARMAVTWKRSHRMVWVRVIRTYRSTGGTIK